MKQFSEYTCAASARIYKTFREGEARENCLVYITRASARVIYARKQLHVACIYYIDPRDIDFVQTHIMYIYELHGSYIREGILSTNLCLGDLYNNTRYNNFNLTDIKV